MSGGPDSLALLLLANEALPGEIAVASVDHGLRPEAQEWEAMLISSLWERRHDVWINSFSQDTPLERS